MFETNKISIQGKISFFSCIIVGILSQGMGLFNKFSVHDDANSLFALGATFNVGRWSLDIIGELEKRFFGNVNYSLPLYNGALSLFFIALTSCIIVKAFEISNLYICVFIGAILACFPTVTTAFGFIYGAHIIMFGLFIGILGAYLICTGNTIWWRLIGILLAATSVGVYQAFIPMMLSFILFYCIHMVWKSEKCAEKEVIIQIILKPLYIIGFMAVYFLINRIYLRILGAELSSYKGVDTVGSVPITQYILRVLVAYKQFLFPSKGSSFYMYPSNVRVLYYSFGVLGALLAGYSLYKKSKQSLLLFIAMLSLYGLVPLATNFIIVMTGPDVIHSYMMYAAVMPFILVAYLVDRMVSEIVIENVLNKTFIVFCCMLLLMYIRYDNKCYFLANYAQQEAISYYTTLITRIKSAEGYDDEYPVAFVNEGRISDATLSGVESVKRKAFDDVNQIPYWNVKVYVNNYAWRDFMLNWCGYKPQEIDAAEVENIAEIDSMPHYPDDGSIKVIDGIVVVNF